MPGFSKSSGCPSPWLAGDLFTKPPINTPLPTSQLHTSPSVPATSNPSDPARPIVRIRRPRSCSSNWTAARSTWDPREARDRALRVGHDWVRPTRRWLSCGHLPDPQTPCESAGRDERLARAEAYLGQSARRFEDPRALAVPDVPNAANPVSSAAASQGSEFPRSTRRHRLCPPVAAHGGNHGPAP
eukprot:2921291-Rhodomonas_salina.1